MTSTRLKKCTCGGTPHISTEGGGFFVRCLERACQARGITKPDVDAAIDEWNRMGGFVKTTPPPVDASRDSFDGIDVIKFGTLRGCIAMAQQYMIELGRGGPDAREMRRQIEGCIGALVLTDLLGAIAEIGARKRDAEAAKTETPAPHNAGDAA